MARKMYGGTPADYFIDAAGAPVPGALANVYNAMYGGTQVTALAAVDVAGAVGATQTQVVADSFGGFRFYGPDAYDGPLFVQSPGGTLRYLVNPTDLAARLADLPTTDFETTAGAQLRADAALDAAQSYIDEQLATCVRSDTVPRLETDTELPAPSSLEPGTLFAVGVVATP